MIILLHELKNVFPVHCLLNLLTMVSTIKYFRNVYLVEFNNLTLWLLDLGHSKKCLLFPPPRLCRHFAVISLCWGRCNR